jgi:hypothetical protein
MACGESDQLIVLGGRESRPQGEGADGDAQPQRKLAPDMQGWINASQPH